MTNSVQSNKLVPGVDIRARPVSGSTGTRPLKLAVRLYTVLMETTAGALLRWILTLAIATTVLYFSVASAPPSGSSQTSVFAYFPAVFGFGSSQWLHFCAYAGLAYAFAFAIRHWRLPRWQRALVVISVVSLYGVGIEFAQSLTATRVFDPTDMLANTSGASLVIGWYLLTYMIDSARYQPDRDL